MLKRRRRLALGSRTKKRIEVLLLVRVLNDCALCRPFPRFCRWWNRMVADLQGDGRINELIIT
jgi:hypothetical protein